MTWQSTSWWEQHTKDESEVVLFVTADTKGFGDWTYPPLRFTPRPSPSPHVYKLGQRLSPDMTRYLRECAEELHRREQEVEIDRALRKRADDLFDPILGDPE